MRGYAKKLVASHGDTVEYSLPLDDDALPLNPLIGSRVRLEHHGSILCQHCGRASRKSYSQGYCYPCFKKLPQCDLCMVSPERCHFEAGTCRDESFAESFCMQPHVVYLANSSGLKVGITKYANIPTRWIDQGAVQAMPMLETQSRQIAGFAEVIFKAHVSDKTQWQRMLKAEPPHVDLIKARADLLAKVGSELQSLTDKFGEFAFSFVTDPSVTTIRYPVDHYPTKVTSLNFEKTPVIEGTLVGIKGQYLIFDIGVLNVRRFTSYDVELTEVSAGLFSG
jgi:hypothetical protein